MVIFALIGLGILPGLVWLLFYLQEDKKRPEPLLLLSLVFLAGMLVTMPTVGLEVLFRGGLRILGFDDYGITSFTVLALIEEITKFGAAYLIIRWRVEFDEPIDAMIYLVTVALGFATAENIAVNSGLLSTFGSDNLAAASLLVGDAFDVTTRRFIGATLLHSLSSGIVGYYWAKGLLSGMEGRFILIGLFLGTLLHAIFNYLIIRDISVMIPTAILGIIAFFVLNDFEKLKSVQVS